MASWRKLPIIRPRMFASSKYSHRLLCVAQRRCHWHVILCTFYSASFTVHLQMCIFYSASFTVHLPLCFVYCAPFTARRQSREPCECNGAGTVSREGTCQHVHNGHQTNPIARPAQTQCTIAPGLVKGLSMNRCAYIEAKGPSAQSLTEVMHATCALLQISSSAFGLSGYTYDSYEHT